jgi:hypothetical protein
MTPHVAIQRGTPVAWGILDLGFFGWYVGTSLWAGHLPIYSNLRSAGETATSFSSLLPVVIAAVAALLYVSIPMSGAFLCLRKELGAVLAYIQFPFRLALWVPSLFFIPWLLVPLDQRIAFVTGIGVVVFTELLKLWSLWVWRSRAVT